MSTAYYIALDRDVDFDTFVNGKGIAEVLEPLSAFCKEHGLKTIEDYYSMDVGEFLDEVESPDNSNTNVEWYDANEGIQWIDEMVGLLSTEHTEFRVEHLIEELKEYKQVLERAQKAGAKWHLELDI